MNKLDALKEEAKLAEEEYWKDLAEVFKTAYSRMATDEDAPAAAVVSAGKEVFDRAYGKVAEKVKLEGEVKLNLDLLKSQDEGD